MAPQFTTNSLVRRQQEAQAARPAPRPRLSRAQVRDQYHLDEEPLVVQDPESLLQRRIVRAVNDNPDLQGRPFLQLPNDGDPDGFDLIFDPTDEDKADWIGVTQLGMPRGVGRQFYEPPEVELSPEEEIWQKATGSYLTDQLQSDPSFQAQMEEMYGVSPAPTSRDLETGESEQQAAEAQAVLEATIGLLQTEYADLAEDALSDPALRLSLRQQLVERIPDLLRHRDVLTTLGI